MQINSCCCCLMEFKMRLNKMPETISNLLGDFNLDLLRYNDHNITNDFLDTLFSHCYMPLIKNPTRITSHSATLIDNIFVNDLSIMQELLSGLLFSDISDHLPIFTILPISTPPSNNENIKVFRRNINPITQLKFQMHLNNCNWYDVYQSNDANDAYDVFLEKFNNIYNFCFPFKELSRKKLKFISKPWISIGLFTSIKNKSVLYKKFLNNPSETNKHSYKQYKNKLSNLLRIAKKKYYDHKFDIAKGNLRETWKVLNNVINKKTIKAKLPSVFTEGNIQISNPYEIANKFCNFFTNVGSSLANKLPQSNVTPESFLTNRVSQSIFISPVTEKEIIEVSTIFKSGKAAGFDGINMTHVKANITSIAGPLTYLINLSLSTGTVPDNTKLAKIVPVYKSESRSSFTNYRPISLLPCFSKFFEKIIYNRFVDFLDKHNVFYDHQYGFRQNYLTNLAMIQLVHQISNSIDNKEICAGIFLDLSKAFDTVNHVILLNKLEHYGIRGIALDWIKSYLHNRKQFVECLNVYSEPNVINCGIPQGSILGPLLFILYINDIANSSKLLKFILFADDTNIFYSCNNLENFNSILNTELEIVSQWLIANKLSINLKKTKYVIFRSRQKTIDHLNFSVKINSKPIECKQSIKFLGVIIDQHLTWKDHIDTIASKISRSIGVISKARYFISQTSLLQLYYSLVYPYLYYGNVVWGSTYKTRLKRLLILQKRIIRIITNSPFDAHTSPLFKKLSLLKIDDIHSLQVALFMHSVHFNSIPNTFQNLFKKNSEVYNYATRHANDYTINFSRTNIHKSFIVSSGPRLWNSLPFELKSKKSIFCFKKHLKKYLISQASVSDNMLVEI